MVDGGTIVSQGESTIIDFINGELKIIREGSITKEEIDWAVEIIGDTLKTIERKEK